MKRFKVLELQFLCIHVLRRCISLRTQLIQGVGVERMFLGGSSGRPRSLTWGASDQTDSK